MIKLLLTLIATLVPVSCSVVHAAPRLPKDFIYQTDKPVKTDLPSVEAAPGAPVKVDKTRLVEITDVIDAGILTKANQLYALASKSRKPIDIIIDSPGGSVNAGLYFIEAMHALQEKNIVIRCHVENLAASMAYVIFTQCNERNALPYALLLFHPPRVQGKFLITPQFATSLSESLTLCEQILVGLIIPVMGINEENLSWFTKNYLEERLFTGTELAKESPVIWFKVVSEVVR